MPRQRLSPRDEFRAKLKRYLADYIEQSKGAGAKLTREIIAKKLGDYNRVSLYRWLDGTNTMSRDVVDKLCTLIGLSSEQRNELLWLGGYIEAPALPPQSRRIEDETEVHVTQGSDPLIDTTNSVLQTWQYMAESGVCAVAVSGDGELVVAGTLGKTVYCLDGDGGLRWKMPVGNQAWRVALSLNKEVIIVGTGSTRPWDLGGRGLYCFAGDGSRRWRIDLDASVWGMAIAADGSTIAVGTDRQQLLLFDHQGHQLWQHDVPGIGWYAWVWSTGLSADGNRIVAGAADQRVRLFARTGKLLAEHRTRGDVYTVAIAQNGTAIAAGDNDRYIYMLDDHGNLLWEELLADKVWAVVLSADGSRLLVGAGERERHLRMYDQAGRLVWRRYVGGSVSSVALSQDGQQISAGTRDGGILIFSADGAVVYQGSAGKSVREVALSITGEHAVAGSEDGKIYGFRLPRSASAVAFPIRDEFDEPPAQ